MAMMFSAVSSVLLMCFCFATSDSSGEDCNIGSTSEAAEAFYESVQKRSSLNPVFDTKLPAKEYYIASSRDFTNLGVKNPSELAGEVRDVVEKVFPSIDPDISKRIVTNNIADFLTKRNIIDKGNQKVLVNLYDSFLQKGADEADGDPKYLARNGFHGLVGFLVTIDALNGRNAREFFDPLFQSYYNALECADSN